MSAKDASDPEHKDSPTEVTAKAPRTKIEDLPPRDVEVSEEEATQVVGGLVYVTPQNVPTLGPALLVPAVQKATSIKAFTTGGIPPDQDNVPDKE
jgi:hypothetical protein